MRGLTENRLSESPSLDRDDVDRDRSALAPSDLAKLHAMATDAEIEADIETAREENVTQTPALVCIIHGNRQTMAPIPPYYLLKGYLDQMLSTSCREKTPPRSC